MVYTTTVALRFWRALRASVLYGTEARKAQKIIGDTVLSSHYLPQRVKKSSFLTFLSNGVTMNCRRPSEVKKKDTLFIVLIFPFLAHCELHFSRPSVYIKYVESLEH